MAEATGVDTVLRLQLSRSQQSAAAWLIGALLATVFASGATALALQASPQSRPAAHLQASLVAAVAAAPTPVDVVFAKPAAPVRPHRADRARAVVQVAVPRPATAPRGTDAGSCAGSGWQQRRGEAALASLLHPVPAGVSVSFLPGGGALKGMTYYDRHAVDVYVGSCAAESDTLLRHVVAHEMGHAWDSIHMTDDLRARYLAARGIPAGTPWFGCNTCQDFATPAGDFAETYAQWQRGASDSRSQLAAPASASELAALGAEFFS